MTPETPIHFNRITTWFETLTPQTLSQIDSIYSVDARFRDPFNNIVGLPGITKVYQHMFDTLQNPHFIVTQKLVQGQQAFLAWEFHFRLQRWRPGIDQCINGTTLLFFDAQGRVSQHRDYWDTAEELYEKLPLLGALMRWLRKAGSASRKTAHADRSSP